MGRREKYPYWDWEDYQAGLYDLNRLAGTVADALDVLRSSQLQAFMAQAVAEWPKAAAHHLTDDGMNQRAWLGWAACALAAKCPAHITRAAWWRLTDQERHDANAVADTIIAEYQSPYAETLFDD